MEPQSHLWLRPLKHALSYSSLYKFKAFLELTLVWKILCLQIIIETWSIFGLCFPRRKIFAGTVTVYLFSYLAPKKLFQIHATFFQIRLPSPIIWFYSWHSRASIPIKISLLSCSTGQPNNFVLWFFFFFFFRLAHLKLPINLSLTRPSLSGLRRGATCVTDARGVPLSPFICLPSTYSTFCAAWDSYAHCKILLNLG